ncbi:MAG: DUF1552 domain-containing protein [Polyangiaceae bacterium]|nr:DUF1552 domain-containing protein [Polyangiaceae bacterium]
MSQLAIAEPGGANNRFMVVYVPHGLPNEHYEVGDNCDLAQAGVGILSPLEPYKKYLTVPRGVTNNYSTNHAAIRSTLTGNGKSNSIDFAIASELGVTAHALAVRPNEYCGSWGACTIAEDGHLLKHGGWAGPVMNPADAVADLFSGLSASSSPADSVLQDAQFRAAALQLTEGEVSSMKAALAGLTAEENKLQLHLESLQAIRSNIENPSQMVSCDSRPSLPLVDAAAGVDELAEENFGTLLKGHLQAAAQALRCGSARVVALQLLHTNANQMMNFPGGPGIAGSHHADLSHATTASRREDFAKAQKWIYQTLADEVLSVLDVPDPSGAPGETVLDNTTILVCSEIADGAEHNSEHLITPPRPQFAFQGSEIGTYLPWTIIGRGGGYFQGGISPYVKQEDHRNVLAAVAESMGVSLTNWGGAALTPTAALRG